MKGDNMKQDSAALRQIAQTIKDNADKFKNFTTFLVNLVDASIGMDESHHAWYGPQADRFRTMFEKYETAFNNAYDSIINEATRLTNQANTWDSFEGE